MEKAKETDVKTKTYIGELVVMECSECGIGYAIPEQFRKERLRNHNLDWCCPSGHCQVFAGKTEAEKLRDELASVRVDATRQYQSRRTAERSLRATKGHFTRLKKRVSLGECPCPCCGSVFKNLRRHMAKKHPDFVNRPDGEAASEAKGAKA